MISMKTKIKFIPNIFRQIMEIANDHNFGSEYARNLKFVLECAVLITLLYSTELKKNHF